MDLDQINELRDNCDKLLGAGSGLESKKKMFNAILFVLEKLGICWNGCPCSSPNVYRRLGRIFIN